MPTLTIAIPDDLKKRMDEHDTVNWSAVARKAFEQQVKDMDFMREFTRNSTMAMEDAIKHGKNINKAISKKYRATWKVGKKN